MKIDKVGKTITASSWELFQVQNYLNHCLTNEERKSWKINIQTSKNNEVKNQQK